MLRSTITCLAVFLAAELARAEPPFVDDRSSASSLVESLYNAINRKEFARAWDYFSVKPAKDFASFAKGYENTTQVEIMTGVVTEDSGAGSTFSTVPVAIQTFGDNEAMFAGCYTVRRTTADMEPPFRPLVIEGGKLKKIEPTTLADALPDQCDNQPNIEFQRGMLAKAQEKFEREFAGNCQAISSASPQGAVPQVYLILYREEGADPASEPATFLLFSFPCNMGAYNSIEVYYGWDKYEGIRQLQFPMPTFDFEYGDENSAVLKSMKVTGFTSWSQLANSNFDEKTETISMFSKWRGIGDAGADGAWVFKEGRFELRNYDVDPTYDEEATAISIMKDGKLLPLP
jgi:hypothetical protein